MYSYIFVIMPARYYTCMTIIGQCEICFNGDLLSACKLHNAITPSYTENARARIISQFVLTESYMLVYICETSVVFGKNFTKPCIISTKLM